VDRLLNQQRQSDGAAASTRASVDSDPAPQVVELASLGPGFDRARHGIYVDLVMAAIARPEGNQTAGQSGPSLNLAVTGPYGAGKSSILGEVQRQIGDERSVSLSLSTLTSIDPALNKKADEDGKPLPSTNHIQKEIIKQLLYSAAPGATPESRFQRIEPFTRAAGILSSIAGSVGFFVIATLAGIVELFQTRMTAGNLVAAWIIDIVLAVALGIASWLVVRALHARVRIGTVSAGPASISLANPDRYFFDQFLDEVVYFFEATKIEVVILEDIDRFEDVDIFDSLRGLNDLLNRSKRIGRPITFVYAVRDSVFADIDARTASARGASDADGARTKFFDRIVPVVPFVTRRTAQDLLAPLLAKVAFPPNELVLRTVGPHLGDMRIIRNVVNEYRVFADRLLTERNPLELDRDHLFAIVAYKNLAPRSFERIARGESELDDALRRLDAARLHTMAVLGAEIDMLLSRDRLTRRIEQDMKTAQEQLLRVLQAGYRGTVANAKMSLGGKKYSLGTPLPEPFWAALANTTGWETLSEPGQASTNVDVQELRGALLDLLPKGGFEEANRTRTDRDRAVLEARREALRWASLRDLITDASLQLRLPRTEEGESDPSDANVSAVTGADILTDAGVSAIAIALMRAGYIDRDFVLHVAAFEGTTTSVNAMTFVIRQVDRGEPDPVYRFDGDRDMEAVLLEVGDSLASQPSVLNLQLVSYIADKRPDLIGDIADLIVDRRDHAGDFLRLYLNDPAANMRVFAAVAKRDEDLLSFIAAADRTADAPTRKIVNTVLENASRIAVGDRAEDIADLLLPVINELPLWKRNVGHAQSEVIADVIDAVGISLANILRFKPAQRRAIAVRARFDFTAANLKAATQSAAPVPAIDELFGLGDAVKTMLRENLVTYIGLCRDHSASAITNGDELTGVVAWLIESGDETALESVLECTDDSVVVGDVTLLPKDTWRVLARTGHVAATAGNLIALHGVDMVVAHNWLLSVSALDCTSDVQAHEAALIIGEASSINADGRVDLIATLKPSPIAASEFGSGAGTILGLLVDRGVVPDSLATLEDAADRGSRPVRDVLAVSAHPAAFAESIDWDRPWLAEVFNDGRLAADTLTVVARTTVGATSMSRDAASAVVAFELGAHGDVDGEGLLRLANALRGQTPMLRLLAAGLPRLDYSEVRAILVVMGGAWERLTRTGSSGVTVADTTENRLLLEWLLHRADSPVKKVDHDKRGRLRSAYAHPKE